MDSRSWHQQSGSSSGGQSSRTTYTSSSSSYNNNNNGLFSTSSSSHNDGGHSISSFEGFPSFDTLSQPSFTSLTREENHGASGFDSKLKSLEDRGTTLAQKDQDRSAEWDKKMKEVQDRQEALAKEEKERAESYEQKLKDLQAREDELAKREEQERSSKADSDNGKGLMAAADNDMGSEEDAEKVQAKKEADIQRKLDDLKLTEQKVAADRAALDQSRTDLAAERKEFQQRVKEFEDAKSSAENDALQAKKNLEQRDKEMAAEQKAFQKRVKEFEDARSSAEHVASQAKKNLEQQQKAAQNQTPSTPKKTTPATKQHECRCTDGVSEADLQKKQRENAKLEQRLAKLEKQLSQMCAASIISERSPKAEGTTKSTVFSNGTGTAGCGYKHYTPPRKLNRKLIGMVYE